MLGDSPTHANRLLKPYSDGRTEAYGWSVPEWHLATTPSSGASPGRTSKSAENTTKSVKFADDVVDRAAPLNMSVPVPVHCRPIEHSDTGMKGSVTGTTTSNSAAQNSRYLAALHDAAADAAASVDDDSLTQPVDDDTSTAIMKQQSFSKNKKNSSSGSSRPELTSSVDGKSVSDELKELESSLEAFETTRLASEQQQQRLSSYVWLCSSTHSMSQVSIIDADKPDHVLVSFSMHSTQLLCCLSVPGVQPSHYPTRSQMDELARTKTRTIQRPNITTKLGAGELSTSSSPDESGQLENSSNKRRSTAAPLGNITFVKCSTGNEPPPVKVVPVQQQLGTGDGGGEDSPAAAATTTTFNITQVDANYVNSAKLIQSFEPTVWLGGQNGVIYIHSACANWQDRLFRIQLQDSIITMVHCRGRVFVALADGQVAVFHRYAREALGASPLLEHVKEMQQMGSAGTLDDLEGFWDIGSYHLIDIGKPQHSVRCMCVVADDAVWACYRNKVHVLDPLTLRVRATFDAHPREESSVRNLAWHNDGVWLSIRLDSTLRLFHAHTYEHLQDVDVEPFVGCMLRANRALGFTLTRITALLIACRQLWIGTSNGVIVSVPLTQEVARKRRPFPRRDAAKKQPAAADDATTSDDSDAAATAAAIALTGDNEVRVYADNSLARLVPASLIPFCGAADARISCLGHKDVVKFFVAVPAGGAAAAAAAEGDDAVGPPQTNSSTSKKSTPSIKLQSSLVGDKMTPSRDGGGQHLHTTVLIMSGGEGCVDFRHPDNDDGSSSKDIVADAAANETAPSTATNEASSSFVNVGKFGAASRTVSGSDMSHLLVWSLENV